jgi:hypothetical protein
MQKDALLEAFQEFEIAGSEKSKILGGIYPNGCNQSGSNSYIDYYVPGVGQVCNYHLEDRVDADGWCQNLL